MKEGTSRRGGKFGGPAVGPAECVVDAEKPAR